MIGYSRARSTSVSDRVHDTVELLQRRGYALKPARLAGLCLGGPISESEVRWVVAASPDLDVVEDLVIDRSSAARVNAIRSRALAHESDAGHYLRMTIRFVRTLVAAAPFIRSVSIAGSLASGGFRASDDVDLNLIVEDGYRHLAYVAVNSLGLLHALAHRAKPVDDLTRRPLAPRLMTANLILERSMCHPLPRQDEQMAFEVLMAEPVFGADEVNDLIAANPALVDHFPQLALKSAPLLIDGRLRRLPDALFPGSLDGVARLIGRTAWRYMQWTRRHCPQALARVAYVRETMHPFALFEPQDR